MAIPDPSKAGSPFCVLQTDGWNPKTPEINNFFIPEIALRGGYHEYAREPSSRSTKFMAAICRSHSLFLESPPGACLILPCLSMLIISRIP